MMRFKSFFKTRVGMLPQSETGAEKKADAATDIMRSGGFSHPDPPAPPPPPPSSEGGGSLASSVTSGLNKLMGG